MFLYRECQDFIFIIKKYTKSIYIIMIWRIRKSICGNALSCINLWYLHIELYQFRTLLRENLKDWTNSTHFSMWISVRMRLSAASLMRATNSPKKRQKSMNGEWTLLTLVIIYDNIIAKERSEVLWRIKKFWLQDKALFKNLRRQDLKRGWRRNSLQGL